MDIIPYPETFATINCVLNAPLTVISIFGNALVLAAILRTPSLRSPSTVFLCSLAVSDLLVELVVQPVYICYMLKPSDSILLADVTLSVLACGVSLCTMTAISVDRFLALLYHMRYPNLMTTKRSIYLSATLWFTCIPSSFLTFWNKNALFLFIALGISICLSISTFSYIKIYRIVRRHRLQIHAQQQVVENLNAARNLHMVRSTKSAQNTFIYYICMILCYFPMFISSSIFISQSHSTTFWALGTTKTVVFFNSSINPCLYCWRLRDLRTAVFKLLREIREHAEGN